jgi:hypothetical protein
MLALKLSRMWCWRCSIRKAVATGGLCALCFGGVTAAGSPLHEAGHRAPSATVSAPPFDHAEQPHPPEAEATYPVRPGVADHAPASFRLDDPVLGSLDHNTLAR